MGGTEQDKDRSSKNEVQTSFQEHSDGWFEHGEESTLNIGLVGYGFMGRAHSNAFRQAERFFDLPFTAGVESDLRAQRRARAGVRVAMGL